MEFLLWACYSVHMKSPQLKEKALAILESLLSAQAPRSSRPGVSILGDMAVDRFVFGNVDRISPEAPVPVLWVDKSEDKAGCAANVARNIAVLNNDLKISAQLFGFIGNDEGSHLLKKILQESCSNIDLNLELVQGWQTPLKTRYIAGSQHQLLRVDQEKKVHKSDAALSLPKVWEAKLSKSSIIICQDYAKGLLRESFLRENIELAKKNKILIYIDPNRNTPGSWYKGATLLTPNIDEAERLCGYDLERGQNDALILKAAQEICANLDLEGILITRGKHGMTGVYKNQESFTLPSFARDVYDVTGAGDTVISALAMFGALGCDLALSAYIANAAASVVVSKVGTAVATLSEIKHVIEHQ